MLLLCALIVGSGVVWGKTYKLTQVTSVSAGNKYVFERNSHVLIGTISNKALQTTSTYSSTNLTGSEAYVWTLESATGGFYVRNVSKGNATPYLHNASGTDMSFTAASTPSIWSISFTSGVALISNTSNSNRFLGETDSGNNTYKAYATSNLSSYGHDFTVYRLDEEASTFSVTYNANGGSGDNFVDNNGGSGYSSGATVTVLANEGDGHPNFTKTGHSFELWSDKSDPNADGAHLYDPSDDNENTFSITGNTTLYAVWSPTPYNVAISSVANADLYAEYGTSGMLVEGENANIDYGTELTLTADELADGYMFVWEVTDESSNDVTDAVLSGNILTVPAYNITISGSVIVIPKYTVTFNAGSGSCATTSLQEESLGSGVTLPTPTISVMDWSFAGWATASTTNTEIAPTLYTAGETYHPTDNCTLYAVYQYTSSVSGEFKRATSLSDITSASSVVIVYSTTAVLNATNDQIGKSTTVPSESAGIISNQTNTVFTLAGDNTSGFTLTNSGCTLGATDNNAVVSNTTSNSTWKFETSSSGTNNFVLLNTAWENNGIQYYSSNFKVYTNASYKSTNTFAMKVYVPNVITVYNSNPAAIINPTIAFTTAGNKNLYVQDEANYTNVANVTGLAKTPEYTSSNATVATVSEAGVVTALKSGSTTITAKVAAEIGVNTEASVTYEVTVKDAKTIAGIKALTSTATAKSFTADLTDAVVTYVNGDHAYIQDESGAIYASCGSSLAAGKKINGAITGSVKAANQIDEITAINLSSATLTDGVIPSAATISAATLAANKTDYEGKLVRIENATVTASLSSGSASGGKISDDGKTTEINLYAPKSNIEALKDAEGTFNGYISLYSGSSIRFNIYEQTQITLTKNAPMDQPLSFASGEIKLDEETDDFDDFTGQTVSGAIGIVTYSIDTDDDGIVTSINASTGEVVLSGNLGTATIKASAAAKEVTEAEVTTPYNATTKTYTITVRPRYTSTFSILGTEYPVRQASYEASIVIPTPMDMVGEYKFMGWALSSAITGLPSDDAPSMTTPSTTPETNETYYAVYALKTNVQTPGDIQSVLTLNAGNVSSPYENNGVTWTHSGLTFVSSGNGNMPNGSYVTFALPNSATSIKSVSAPAASGWSTSNVSIALTNAEETQITTFNNGISYNFTDANNKSSSYTLTATNADDRKAYMNTITIVYVGMIDDISYSDYCTTIDAFNISLTADTWVTYCFPVDVVIPDDARLKVYKSEVNAEEDALNVTAITGNLKAGEGVLMKANTTADDYTFSRYTGGDATPLDGNALKGCVVATHTDVLKAQNGDCTYIMVLDKTTGNFGTFSGTFPGGKAYLPFTPSTSAPSAFRIVEVENNATSIDELRANEKAVKFFENGQLFIKKNGITYDALGRIVK